MSYTFERDKFYRMPTHFGPSLGPRQGPGGCTFSSPDSHATTSCSVSFLSRSEQLEEFLPPGFTLDGEPVVTVTFAYYTNIEWLAGRGYNTLGVSIPARFDGKVDHAVGKFLTVLWENLTDPIITGREELGFSKIYCELPEPRSHAGRTQYTASWLGFKFLDLWTADMVQEPTPAPGSGAEDRRQMADGTLRGMLHYKYMPRTGEWGTADAAYATLTPDYYPRRVIHEVWKGEGRLQFHAATWEDLPTQYTIVNAFAALDIREYRGATLERSTGNKDLSDQRILR
jgi:hypothetical protein